MAEEPLPSGWLPPKAPTHFGEAAPPRATGPRPRPPQPQEPAVPAAIAGIALGAVSLLLTIASLGVGYLLSALIALAGLSLGTSAQRRIRAGMPGREGQARAAVIVASAGLGLAFVAGIVWYVLAENGFTPDELQDALQRAVERQRAR